MSTDVRVLAVTAGEKTPSARFRVRQHVDALAGRGVRVHEAAPPIVMSTFVDIADRRLRWPIYGAIHTLKSVARIPAVVESWRHDVTWLQKELLPGVPSWEPALKKPLVFDLDDAEWLVPPAGRWVCALLAKRADVILAGNEYLASWFSSKGARRIEIVPTAVDTAEFSPRDFSRDPESKPFTIGWIGSAPTLTYLAAIETPLARFLELRPEAQLVVCCNARPELSKIPPARWRFIEWSPQAGPASVREQMDVGLMPLSADDWSRGKCSMKMLQYMSCALPVVVSPVGMNADLLAMGDIGMPARDDGEWVDALLTLERDRAARLRMGQAGRALIERSFSRDVIAERLAQIFRSLA